MRLESGSRLGPYEITGSIGAGGMGEVYPGLAAAEVAGIVHRDLNVVGISDVTNSATEMQAR